MSEKRRLLLIGWTVVLALCLLGSFLTRGAMANLPFLKRNATKAGADVVNQTPLQTAQALAPLAISAEEQAFAHEAVRLADHEVDQAFAMALRQANAENRTLTGKALEVAQKVTALQQTVKQDQAEVDALVASAKARGAGANDDDLDVAKAQLALDNDELSDTQDNLAVVSGDQRSKIQEELASHEAGMKKYTDQAGGNGQTAVVSARKYGTLAGRLGAWFDQRSRMSQIKEAQQQADADAVSLKAEASGLQQKATALSGQEKVARTEAAAPVLAVPSASFASTPQTVNTPRPTRLALLRKLEAQRNILGILNERMQGQQELSALYGKWLAQVELQHSIVLHLLMQSFAWIAFIVLCSVLTGWLMMVMIARSKLKRQAADRRSMQTLQTILQLAIQFVMLLLILLVIFGPPSQIPTILGLATAGLTVVFQD